MRSFTRKIFLTPVKMSDTNENASIFVFYDGFKLEVHELIGGWKWLDTELTYPAGTSEQPKYKYKMQFMGPHETREEAKKIIDEKLHVMKDHAVIKHYHMQDTCLPVPV